MTAPSPCFSVGGLRFAVAGPDAAAALQLPGFAPFVCGSDVGADLWVHTCDHLPPAEGHQLMRFPLGIGGECILDEVADGLLYRFSSGSRLSVPRRPDAAVQMLRKGVAEEWRYMLWLAYAHGAVPFGAVPVHASAVVWQGRAVLCLGESGTGKSTHTRLWVDHIPGAHLLNDDSPVLRVEPDGVWVYGSPWSGKTPCYRPQRYPLAALLRLRQSPDNVIRRLPTLEALSALLPSCPPTLMRCREVRDTLVELAGRTVERAPVFILSCRPDAEAARLSFSSIFP